MSELKPYVVTITWYDHELQKWSEGNRQVPVLARSTGSEIDAIIEQSFPDGSVKVIDVELSSDEQHEAIFKAIHKQGNEESGDRIKFDTNRYKPFYLEF